MKIFFQLRSTIAAAFFLVVLLCMLTSYGNAGDVTVNMSGIAGAVNGAAIGAGQNCSPTSGWRPPIPNVGLCIHVSNSTSGGTQTFTRSGTSGARIAIIADNKWGPTLSAGEFDQAAGVAWIMIEGLQFTGPSNKFVMLYSSGHDSYFEYNFVHDVNNNACNSASDKNGVIHATTAPYLNLTVNGNIMRHFGGSGCAGGSGFHGFYLDVAGLVFTNNVCSGGSGGWCLQKQYAGISDCTPGVISGNTIFNNQGGIVLNDEGTSNGMACGVNHWTITNNIIVNNGIAGTGGGGSAYGIDFFHTSHAPQTLVSNNMIYGNLPANINCGLGGCPSVVNTRTDASTAVTFTAFQTDTNQAPAASYSANNYQLGSNSAALSGGTPSCAAGGLTPCSPSGDFLIATRGNPPSLGAFDVAGGTTVVSSLIASPTTLTFGTIPVGTDSTVQVTTVTNNGNVSVTLNLETIAGTNSGDFLLGGIGTCNTNQTLAPGQSCTLSIKFHPLAIGGRSGQISQPSTASNSPVLVALTGTGGAPLVSLTPTSFNFGNTQVGTSSSAQLFAFSNPGTAPLTYTISTSSGIFVQSNTCPSPMPAGGNCNISVTFQPSASGPQTGLLTVTSNSVSSPDSSNLSGTGIVPAGLTLSPSSTNFANTLVKSFSPVTNITVVNPNPAAVTITSITMAGTNPLEFNAGACSVSTTAFTDNFNNGSLDLSRWQIDTGAAPGAIGGVNSGTFSSSNIDFSQGVLGLKVTQTGASPVTSVGAEIRGLNAFGFGNYFWRMRASSTATSPYGAGSATSGQVSSTFLLNSAASNPYTEIDSPEIEGQHPNSPEWTSWTTTSLNTSVTTSLANPEAAFHVYRFDWQPASIVFQVDGVAVATNSTNIPSASGNPMVNHWGTNSATFGGLAATGTTRWMYVSGFAFTPSGITTIPAGGTCTIPVFFAPSSAGSKAATVSIVDSATGSPHQATFTGLATAAAASITGPLNFGNQTVGTTSPAQNVTLANTGNGPMWFTIALTGAQPNDYILSTSSCVSPLAGGQNCLIPVQFKPTTGGVRAATITVTDSASGSPHTALVSGTGVATAPAVCLSTSSLAFGNQPINTNSGTKPVNVTNCGSNTLTVSGVNSTITGIDDITDSGGTTNCTLGQWCWQHDAGTPGTAVGTSTRVASPAIDGQSRQFVTTFTGSGGLRWSDFINFGLLDQTSTAFAYDTQVRVDDLTHVNQLEFDLNQVLPNGQTVIYGTQCNFVAGFWQYTVSTSPTTSTWLSSTIPCTKLGWAAGVFHHLVVRYHRDSTGVVTYDSVAFDGATSAFVNAFGNSSFTLGWTPIGELVVNFQINGDNTSNSVTAYLDAFSVSSTNFSQTNNCTSVAAGAFCTINGMFSPAVVGSIAGQFRILSNAASSPDNVALSGFGTQVGGTLAPTTIAFGSATVGIATTPATVTFTNTGNTSVTLPAPSFTGTNAGDFSAVTACGTVAANATCTMAVSFTAGAPGSRSGTLNQLVGSTILTVSLTGTGVAAAPGASLNPPSVDFGNVQQNAASGIITATLSNPGTATLTISSVLATGANAADIAVTNHCTGSLAAGDACSIDLVCTPATTTAETASLTVTDNAAGSPHSIPLACKGVATPQPRVQPSSTTFTFPSTQIGLSSAAQVIGIINLGNSTLVFSNISKSGANPGDFVIGGGNTCTTVLAGAGCSIPLNFVPTAAGARSATIILTDNASDSPQTINISGTAFAGAPNLLIPISSVDFGNLVVGGTSAPVIFTLTNQGTATATVTITPSTDFSESDNCGGSIPSSNSCSVTIRFIPTVVCGQFDTGGNCISNTHLGQLAIVSNTVSSPQNISLQGTALSVTPPQGPVVVGMGGKTGTGGRTSQGVH